MMASPTRWPFFSALSVLALALSLGACNGRTTALRAGKSKGLEVLPIPSADDRSSEPAPGATVPELGSQFIRVGVGWTTDGPGATTCRIWTRLEWNAVAARFENPEAIALPPGRPDKMLFLIDARPWPIATDVSAVVRALTPDAGKDLGEAQRFASVGYDYAQGPQVRAVLQAERTDLIASDSRPSGERAQDVELTVATVGEGRPVLNALIHLVQGDAATNPCAP